MVALDITIIKEEAIIITAEVVKHRLHALEGLLRQSLGIKDG